MIHLEEGGDTSRSDAFQAVYLPGILRKQLSLNFLAPVVDNLPQDPNPLAVRSNQRAYRPIAGEQRSIGAEKNPCSD